MSEVVSFPGAASAQPDGLPGNHASEVLRFPTGHPRAPVKRQMYENALAQTTTEWLALAGAAARLSFASHCCADALPGDVADQLDRQQAELLKEFEECMTRLRYRYGMAESERAFMLVNAALLRGAARAIEVCNDGL